MIPPTLGRVLWYYPGRDDIFPSDDDGRCAALLVKVNNPHSVNLAVFDALGKTHPRMHVPLVQAGEPAPGVAYCSWSDWQISQVARNEAAEKALAAATK